MFNVIIELVMKIYIKHSFVITHINDPLMYLAVTCFQPNTFQLVLISDASRWSTFVIFSYEKTGWDTVLTTRDSMIGYYATQYKAEHSEVLGVSGKRMSFRLASLKGNTGELLALN